jgi:hypothetical protein
MDTAEKQKLKKLKYDGNSIHRRTTFLRWINISVCSVIRPSRRSSSLPKDKSQVNDAFRIIINSYVEGHWKYIAGRPRLQDKCVEALTQMQIMCTTLLQPGINQLHINITTLKMSPQESATYLICRLNTSKRQDKEAGLIFT